MSFLETWQKKQINKSSDEVRINASGKDVIVIGGGDTGCDCIATSLRQVWDLEKVIIVTKGLAQCQIAFFSLKT